MHPLRKKPLPELHRGRAPRGAEAIGFGTLLFGSLGLGVELLEVGLFGSLREGYAELGERGDGGRGFWWRTEETWDLKFEHELCKEGYACERSTLAPSYLSSRPSCFDVVH
jgi:hypothetical protein